jgi:hypothetical protein
MYIYTSPGENRALKQVTGVGTDPLIQIGGAGGLQVTFANVVMVAVGLSVIGAAWWMYERAKGGSFGHNPLTPWPALGPIPTLFLGPKFWLGTFLV